MEKSEYTLENQSDCGCSASGLGSPTGYVHTTCGCQGVLGEGATGQPPKAPETKKDLINQAKKYINAEIPTSCKIVAGVGAVLLLILATRGN